MLSIKEIRQRTGLSQTQFANKYHISKSTLCHWEQGIRKPPQYILYLIETIITQELIINNIKKEERNNV